jgi:transcriptional regulator with XRE-family HTH domain
VFSENLQRLRKAAGLTQAALSKRLKVSLRTLQNWEQGQREPRLDVLEKIAKGLGASLDELVTSGPAASGSAKPERAKRARGRKAK